MRALYSFVLWALVALGSPIFFVGALLVFLVTFPFDRRRVALHLYSCLWASCYVYGFPLWNLRVTGRDRLPWRGGAVLAANHTSTLDILLLFALFRPFKWVSKRELFKVPFVGWNMRLNGYVGLVRGDRASVVAMLRSCEALLARGNPIMMFPEGTRSKTGELQPFKDGAFQLAHTAGCPLIPIAIHGTASALPKDGYLVRHRVDAWIEVLEPIPAGRFGSPAALRDATRAAIAEAIARERLAA